MSRGIWHIAWCALRPAHLAVALIAWLRVARANAPVYLVGPARPAQIYTNPVAVRSAEGYVQGCLVRMELRYAKWDANPMPLDHLPGHGHCGRTHDTRRHDFADDSESLHLH